MPIPVVMRAAAGYGPELERLTAETLEAVGFRPGRSSRVLVKPNLVSAKNASLSCTDPAVVRAACAYLLECGATVAVADSPAFGTAERIAGESGLAEALRPLGLKVETLGRPRPLALSAGPAVGVSAEAMEADAILNLPKLKAHGQMRLTGAVKNLFGCVVGFRKAFAHSRLGDQGNLFESLILDVASALPGGASLLDGIDAMSRTGPTGGDPCRLGVLAASPSPVALDTAVYAMLGAEPGAVPLWREAIERGLPGAVEADLTYPAAGPREFDASSFVIPPALSPVTFNPVRLVRGRLKSLCARFW